MTLGPRPRLNDRMHGHELLKTLRQVTAGGRPAAAMLRHAARHPIADPKQPHLAELTTEGHAAAERFGEQLAGYARVRLFHSPVKRCLQTVEGVARGAERRGVAVEILGGSPELGIDYIRDIDEAGRLSVLHGPHFVRLWFDGTIAPTVVDPIPTLAQRKLAYVQARLAEIAAQSGTIDLHVSHDWNIMILREHLCGVRHEEAGWLTYLDGVAFAPAAGGVQAVYRDRAREIALG